MKRHHNLKLPDHLYLSPPAPQSSRAAATFSSAVSLLSSKAAPYTSPAALIQETSSTARAVGDKIPGFRTSAAFLTTLRANLNLDLEHLDSQLNTPDSLRPTTLESSVSSLPPAEAIMADSDFAPPTALRLPKVAPTSDRSEDVTADDPNAIPPLTTFSCDTETTRIEALKLIADSVAQQRQQLSRIIVFHPITLSVLVAAGAALYRYYYREAMDVGIILTTFAGITMSMFAAVRAVAGGYLEEAERVGTWRWLKQGRGPRPDDSEAPEVLGETDEILLTRFGKDPIGAIIFRGVRPASTADTSKKSKKSATQPKTEIRGWAVAHKYRHKGVGTALLEDAVRTAHEKGWAAGGIEVAADHANSKRVLPAVFNGTMDKKDEMARKLLAKKVQEFDAQRGGAQTVGAGSPGASGVSGSKPTKKRK